MSHYFPCKFSLPFINNNETRSFNSNQFQQQFLRLDRSQAASTNKNMTWTRGWVGGVHFHLNHFVFTMKKMNVYVNILFLHWLSDQTKRPQSLRPYDRPLKGNIFIYTLAAEKCFPQQQGELLWALKQKPEVVQKRTFQDPLLVLFVILSNHMTNPRKMLVSVFTALRILFCHDHMVQERKNFGPRDTTCPSIIRKKGYVHWSNIIIIKSYVLCVCTNSGGVVQIKQTLHVSACL